MELFPTQQEVADRVLRLAEGAKDRQIILLVGLSGVGKSSLLETILPELKKASHSVVEGDDFERFKCSRDRSYVVPATPLRAQDIAEHYSEHFPDHELHEVKLMGITVEETRILLQRVGCVGALSDMALEVSMGIPLVALSVAEVGLCDRTIAIGLLARHLFRTRRVSESRAKSRIDAVMPYLHYILDPSDMNRVFSGRASTAQELAIAVQRSRKDHLRQQGLEFEPPIFTACGSEALYDRLFGASFSDLKHDYVAIAVLSDSEKLAQRMEQEVGMVDGFNPLWSRQRHLFCGIRKGDCALFRESFDEELPMLPNYVSPYCERMKKTRLQHLVKPSDFPLLGIYTRDHIESPWGVWIGAIGLETLLQQLGLPYLVDYGHLGEVWRFDPPDQLKRLEEYG